ncbi:MAG: histidinol dehydrogenase [Sedimentisphaerales bacterium]|nr:histidinol dehydrogenase [Sedimentisphaerales bacterium]
MAENLNHILVSSDSPQWQQRLQQVHQAVKQATYFEDGDKNDEALREILRNVKLQGDRAIEDYTQRFDKVTLSPDRFGVTRNEMIEAHAGVDRDLMSSIRQAINNVRTYQNRIFQGKSIPGKVRYTPIRRVGVCVPGASAPLPSTVIMTAVPAIVAGVQEIAVVSPPRFKGGIHPVILAVCQELGIREVYRIGGAHAIAALAFGTQTIRAVDKIVGPGNQWVQMAKRRVFGEVDIDSVAGPSEVLILANEQANPAWIAADMLSQAEHAPGSAFVFTDSRPLAEHILQELEKQVVCLNRAKETAACLRTFSGIIVFERMEEAIEQANRFAAEHLQIQCGDQSHSVAERIVNAGAMFIGSYTPVAVGDYWAGPSHTLPTGTSARFFSPLSSNDFVKSTSIIEYSKKQLAAGSDDIVRLAMTEGLDAHARSVQMRQE